MGRTGSGSSPLSSLSFIFHASSHLSSLSDPHLSSSLLSHNTSHPSLPISINISNFLRTPFCLSTPSHLPLCPHAALSICYTQLIILPPTTLPTFSALSSSLPFPPSLPSLPFPETLTHTPSLDIKDKDRDKAGTGTVG